MVHMHHPELVHDHHDDSAIEYLMFLSISETRSSLPQKNSGVWLSLPGSQESAGE
jgi:hypothetical protein